MSEFAPFHLPSSLDEDLADDFIESVYEAIESIEHDLVILGRDPKNVQIINAIFRTLHSLKGNCRMCFLDPLTDYIHALEDVFSEVRATEIAFTTMLKEAFLLALDLFRVCTERLFQTNSLEAEWVDKLHNQTTIYNRLKSACATEIDTIAAEVVKQIAGDEVEGIPVTSPDQTEKMHEKDKDESDKDLVFFRILSRLLDDRTHYWENRTSQLLSWAMEINKNLDSPVDEMQLKAAIYIHDIGMAFVPDDILEKQSRLNAMEEKSMKIHPLLGYEWLLRIPGWEEAANFVFQHHERPDGKGYPNRVKNEEISDGAKILAVVDSFYSMIHQRADRNYKRSLIRAIKEINAYSGSQFDRNIVTAFNKVVRDRTAKKA